MRPTTGPVAVIHGALRSDTSARRLRGFTEAAAEIGRPLDPDHMREAELSMESGYQVATTLLTGTVFGAVFRGNDQIANGVWRRCREIGIAVPGGLHLYGFDDNPLNEWLAPWLSTIRVPCRSFATTAAQLMEGDKQGEGHEVMLPYDLVIRA